MRRTLKEQGLGKTLQHYAGRAAVKVGAVEDVATTRRRLANHFNNHFDAQIAYGPFKGFRFVPDSWWGATDRASMLFGFYEQEVLAAIVAASGERDIFIDIGAADGYYGVAAVSQNLFKQSYLFEISKEGQAVIAQTAKLNKAEDRITIYGEADADTLEAIDAEHRRDAVVLVDIEGAEFGFLSDSVISLLKDSVVVIEIHDWLQPNGEAELAQLRERLTQHFSLEVVLTAARDLSIYPELQMLSDTERWLLCSEGRGQLMQWWVLTPL